jgi:cell division protein FtsQ
MPRADVLAAPAPFAPANLPPDVRLMNATATALYTLVGFALAAAALHWAVRLPAFAIREIEVHGEVSRNSAATIRAHAMPRLAGNFFTLDLQQAQRAFESVPWVRHAMLRRVWPNRLSVRLEEHRPVALWGERDETSRLVDPQGVVFEADVGQVEDDELPALQGPDGSAPQALALIGRLKPLFARLGDGVDTLAQSGRGSWRAELTGGAVVELGRGSEDEVVARTERFVGTVAQTTSRYERRFEYADLRHHDGYALRLRGITTTLPPAPAAAAAATRKKPAAKPPAAAGAHRP